MEQTFILHDLKESSDHMGSKDMIILNAGRKAPGCKGCFGCWLKTPGTCVMHDGIENTGSMLIGSDKVYIVSSTLYGGFSPEIKRILDRCIGGVLPFFSYRSGKMHHTPRFKKQAQFHIIFYNTSLMTDEEKELAQNIANGVAVNFNASSCQTTFQPGLVTLKEVLAL